MIRAAIVLLGIISAGPVFAQWAGQATAITNGATSYSVPDVYMFSGNRETPTMRQQKLDQSAALREEAARLQAADGGTLSAKHAAYIRKRVRKIIDGRGAVPQTGSLIARR